MSAGSIDPWIDGLCRASNANYSSLIILSSTAEAVETLGAERRGTRLIDIIETHAYW